MKRGNKVRVKSLEEVLKIEGVEDYKDVDDPYITLPMLKYFSREGKINNLWKPKYGVSFDGDIWYFREEWLDSISDARVEEIKNPTYDDLLPLFSDDEVYLDKVDSDTVKEYDTVHKPKHYNVFEREVIYVIKDLLDNNDNYTGFDNYCIGNSLKYIFRAGLKGDFYEDLEKARYYINKILEGKE